MRLLYVHERFGALGGAESNILLTAQELQRRGHDVAIAFGGTDQGASSDWNDVFAKRFPLDADPEAVTAALATFGPDVVFLHKHSDSRILHGLASGDAPVVRMVHDHDLYCMRSYKYNFFTRQICNRAASPFCVFPCGACVVRSSGPGLPLRWVSYAAKRREIEANKRFNRLVVATDYMKDELLKNGFPSDRIEIHAPVPRTARSSGAPSFSSRNLIVYSGQIIRGKGVDVLLRALAKVDTHFECRIFGDGNHRSKCERLSEQLGLGGKVHFEGFVPQSRIVDTYQDASLAVMSSLWPEPFGAAGLEAMRIGLPVIAFDAGGISEWLIDDVNGHLVPWGDTEQFALSVDELLRNKMLAQSMGENGRSMANERFNMESYIDGLERLLSSANTEERNVSMRP